VLVSFPTAAELAVQPTTTRFSDRPAHCGRQGGRRRLWGCERTDPVGIRSQDAHRRMMPAKAAGTAGRPPGG